MARGNTSMFGWILWASVAAPAVARAQTAEPQSDDSTIIAERAVTATKTDTPLVETPQAISVVDDALFHDRGARNVQETLRYSAGVTGEAYGLDTNNDATLHRRLRPVQFLDGMRNYYTYSPLARNSNAQLHRAEVPRGPSSVPPGPAS